MLRPEAVFEYLRGHFQGRSREEMHVISLDTGGRLLGTPLVLQGSVASVPFRPADIFREALMLEARSIILAHNHPSGRPEPSVRDVVLTRQIAATGDLLDIPLHDHVIIAENQFLSLRRDGLLEEAEHPA